MWYEKCPNNGIHDLANYRESGILKQQTCVAIFIRASKTKESCNDSESFQEVGYFICLPGQSHPHST